MNSSILSKTLKEGSWIKKLIFSNAFSGHINPKIHISFLANTLTIVWSRNHYDDLKYLKIMLELWPGLILRLERLEYWNEERLDGIRRWLIYCEWSPPWWKLSFSKVVISIDIDEIDKIKISKLEIEYFAKLSKLKNLCDSLSKIYDVEFENITYEDLFRDRVSQFKKFIERRRDEYNYEKLKFERALKYRRIECYLDNFLNGTNDGFNHAIKSNHYYARN